MKNKTDFKKCLLIVFLTSFLLTLILLIFNYYEYNLYRHENNVYMENVVAKITESYPQIDINEIVDILNNPDTRETKYLSKYGIDIDVEAIALKNDNLQKKFTILNAILIVTSFLFISLIFIFYIYQKEKKIREVTRLIGRINGGDYSLDLPLSSEDELSILRSELYKTTIMLKEQAESAKNDKNNLKKSLEDISHQLKTPLTAISISLDNLLTISMDQEERNETLKGIVQETDKINFLIQSLLKLSSFDTNTIKFNPTKIKVTKLLDKAIENVALIADLKDVTMNMKESSKISVTCDASWQVEAISNILKNAIEHSPTKSQVSISIEDNKLYTSISINNPGVIDKDDIPHIFERFYKGKNATSDSVGIGLSLAKSIVTKDNGNLEVDSTEQKGTTFTIKYYKN